MQDSEQLSLEQIQALLEASEEVQFRGKKRQEVYDWMTLLMRQQGYRKRGKPARGLLRRYMAKMTGLSRAQVTRLIGQYLKNGEVKEAVYSRNQFQRRFTQADIELLAKVDEAHETLMAEVSENRALVVIRNTQALHEVKALILSEQAARNAAKEVFAAKRRGVGPLHRMKTTAWVAGSVAAIATFIPDKILPMMPKNEADVFKPMLGMTAVMAAIIGGFFQFRAT